MWLPNTKTELVNEIKYLLPHYTRWEIERVYSMVINKEPRRDKYYSKRAAIKRLQWWLTTIRKDIKEWDKELSELKYNFIKDEN